MFRNKMCCTWGIICFVIFVWFMRTPDINTCNVDELMSIRGIGEKKAHMILENRPFNTYNDIERINGIGKTVVNRLRWKTKLWKHETIGISTNNNNKLYLIITIFLIVLINHMAILKENKNTEKSLE